MYTIGLPGFYFHKSYKLSVLNSLETYSKMYYNHIYFLLQVGDFLYQIFFSKYVLKLHLAEL